MTEIEELLMREEKDFFDEIEKVDNPDERFKDEKGFSLQELTNKYRIEVKRHDYNLHGEKHNYWVMIWDEETERDSMGVPKPGDYLYASKRLDTIDEARKMYQSALVHLNSMGY
jgi:hypothetical protein